MHTEASFLPNSIDSLFTSRLDAYISRYGDFCAHDNDDDNNDMTDYFTPCACARGNYVRGFGLGIQLLVIDFIALSPAHITLNSQVFKIVWE